MEPEKQARDIALCLIGVHHDAAEELLFQAFVKHGHTLHRELVFWENRMRIEDFTGAKGQLGLESPLFVSCQCLFSMLIVYKIPTISVTMLGHGRNVIQHLQEPLQRYLKRDQDMRDRFDALGTAWRFIYLMGNFFVSNLAQYSRQATVEQMQHGLTDFFQSAPLALGFVKLVAALREAVPFVDGTMLALQDNTMQQLLRMLSGFQAQMAMYKQELQPMLRDISDLLSEIDDTGYVKRERHAYYATLVKETIAALRDNMNWRYVTQTLVRSTAVTRITLPVGTAHVPELMKHVLTDNESAYAEWPQTPRYVDLLLLDVSDTGRGGIAPDAAMERWLAWHRGEGERSPLLPERGEPRHRAPPIYRPDFGRAMLSCEHSGSTTEESFDAIVARTGGYPLLCAHRGGCGETYAPENTMAAFHRSVKEGARLLELDVHLTRDAQLVLMHWDTVDETTDGSGRLADLTLAELQRLDAAHHLAAFRGQGHRVPTLREFLDAFVPVPDLLFCLDFKEADAVRATLAVLPLYPGLAQRVMLSAVFAEANATLLQCRPLPTTPVACTISEMLRFLAFYEMGLLAFFTPRHDVYGFVLCAYTLPLWSPRLIEAIHAMGCRAAVFGYGPELDKQERMAEAVAYGADYIFVDRPDLLRPLIK